MKLLPRQKHRRRVISERIYLEVRDNVLLLKTSIKDEFGVAGFSVSAIGEYFGLDAKDFPAGAVRRFRLVEE